MLMGGVAGMMMCSIYSGSNCAGVSLNIQT